MNLRIVIFSGIITAAIGAMLGLVVVKMGERGPSPRILNERRFVLVGAGLGFALGAAVSAIRQEEEEEVEEPDRQDSSQ